MPYAAFESANYYYQVTGRGQSLLLLHGFTGSRQNWAAHAPALAAHFRVVTVDTLGHGRSSSPTDPARYRLEAVAADVAALIAETADSPVNLLGYSMGGRLALYLALAFPHLVQRLILESASPGLETAAERQARRQGDESLADWIEQHGVAAFVARWEQLPLWQSQKQLPPAAREALRRQRLQNNPGGMANSLRGMGTGAQPSLWPRLGELAMPALLIAGKLDPKFTAVAQQMAAAIPHAQLALVPDAGHAVHLERPSLFNEIVLSFLR